MLVILALPLFFTQAILASPADPSYRELRDLADFMDAEGRLQLQFDTRDAGLDEVSEDFLKKCKQDPLELGLVIDASVSIAVPDFQKGLDFLKEFLEDYVIGPGKNDVRVAAVSYAKGVYTQDGFNLTTDKEEVLERVMTIPFRRGARTDTGRALEHMREVQMQNTRPGVPKVIVVLTDGNSQERELTKSEALLTKQDNITVFAVGVGKKVKYGELLNIAGGQPNQVFMSESYENLTKTVKKNLFTKTCKLVPRPTTPPPPTTTTTTTTTTPMAIQPCGTEYPTDVNFVFSPASLGPAGTNFVTNFISRFIDDDELVEGGFQYGVLSADCPDDEGFHLDRYDNVDSIRGRLHEYDVNHLPDIVSQVMAKRFGVKNGGREDANKVAVIYVGEGKMDRGKLRSTIQEMEAAGVQVFLSATTQRAYEEATYYVPQGARLLDFDTPYLQASMLVSYLCHTNHTPTTPECRK